MSVHDRTDEPTRKSRPWRAAGIGLAALSVLFLAALALGSVARLARPGAAREVRASMSLVETLGAGDTSGFARAERPRPFDFPMDHGPHPDFRTEWWYLTGNLRARSGRRFGYQLTFFRSALSPEPPEVVSGWSTDQAWMAHFALTDVRDERFHAFDRFDRQALGLAGADAVPFRVWLGEWEMAGSGDGLFPLTVRAAEGGVAVALSLEPLKDLVLQGDRGLSRKGPQAGNASFYYSFTRLATSGTVVSGADTVEVRGESWMDREWSTSVLPDDVVGWDWFALQLEGERELMVYSLRRGDGSIHPLSEGVWVGPRGEVRRLSGDGEYSLDVLNRWTTPLDGTVYPNEWRITVPVLDLDVTVTPVMDDQELNLAFRYWEGAVDVSGELAGEPLGGVGYVELTGYGSGEERRSRSRSEAVPR